MKICKMPDIVLSGSKAPTFLIRSQAGIKDNKIFINKYLYLDIDHYASIVDLRSIVLPKK